jgi:hypothetical protein
VVRPPIIDHRSLRVAVDEQQQTHIALPRLYGAPAYARPRVRVAEVPRPFDPDDLPIVAEQTDEERVLVETLPARAYAPGGGLFLDAARDRRGGSEPRLSPRPFRLKHLAGRLLGRD